MVRRAAVRATRGRRRGAGGRAACRKHGGPAGALPRASVAGRAGRSSRSRPGRRRRRAPGHRVGHEGRAGGRAAARRSEPAGQPVEPEQRRAEDRRRVEPLDGGAPGRPRGSRLAIRASKPRPAPRKTPPARTTIGVAAGQVQAADDRDGHRRELVGQPVEDRRATASPPRGRGEDDRRQLAQRGLGESARTRWRWSRRSAGACRSAPARAAPATVRGPRPSRARTAAPERGHADVPAAAPVARDGAERREPGASGRPARSPPR